MLNEKFNPLLVVHIANEFISLRDGLYYLFCLLSLTYNLYKSVFDNHSIEYPFVLLLFYNVLLIDWLREVRYLFNILDSFAYARSF